MLYFPNCKINLGLNIIRKRSDGYHDIESVFYPVNWCDSLEIIEGGEFPFNLYVSGLKVDGKLEDNIVYKAWKLLSENHHLPNMKVYLHKVLPMGAGLGGGSSNAAFFMRMANEKFNLNLSDEQLIKYTSKLGADCAFFIRNKPVLATGIGNEFNDIKVNLSGFYLLLVYPGIISNTKEAYDGIIPSFPSRSVKEIVEGEKPEKWKNLLINDFEKSIFIKYPEIKEIKEWLYNEGAVYACMSGSGSTVFGIFKSKKEIKFPESFLRHWVSL